MIFGYSSSVNTLKVSVRMEPADATVIANCGKIELSLERDERYRLQKSVKRLRLPVRYQLEIRIEIEEI